VINIKTKEHLMASLELIAKAIVSKQAALSV
jgi:hypothetical protein